MEDIKEIISWLNNTKFKHNIKGLKLYEQWEDIAGKNMSSISQPIAIRNGILLVAVKNSIALQELIYNRHQILESINKRKNMPFVKDVKVHIRTGYESNDL